MFQVSSCELREDGFVALISVIIITALLLIISFTLSFAGYYARFNTLNMEFKKQSVALAEACVDTARLDIASGITPPNTVSIGADHCTIVSVVTVGSQTIIETQAAYNNVCYKNICTNLKVIVDSNNLIVSWQEVPHF